MEKLTLGSHYSVKNILRQCAVPILMMLFVSLYGLVDGLFISNFDSSDAFAGVNLIFPVICIVGGAGYMFGSGGSALASKFLGEKNNKDADRVFSMMISFGFLVGLVLSVVAFHFIDNLVELLSQYSVDYNDLELVKSKAITYGKILICSQPFYIVSCLFQNFFVVDEKENLGFLFSLASGITNIIFDALFIVVFRWGVAGAAIATAMGHIVGSVGPILYFAFGKKNLIHLVKTKFDFRIIGKCSFNGLSDFIVNISTNIIGLIYNVVLLYYLGKAGIIAQGAIMYIAFVFISIFIGINIGMGPVISYHFGAKNKEELRFAIKNTLIILGLYSLFIFVISEALSGPIVSLFIKETEYIDLSKFALRLYSISFLFMGTSVFIIGMFTALNDGLVSGILSLFRSFIFPLIFLIVLPLFLDSLGVWLAVIFAESSSLLLSLVFLFIKRKKYNY